MTAAQFWFGATYAIGIGLVCVAAAVFIFEARALAAGAKRISRSLFPPAPSNVVDFEARRRLLDFTVRQPESVDLKILRTMQRGRDYSQKGFGS